MGSGMKQFIFMGENISIGTIRHACMEILKAGYTIQTISMIGTGKTNRTKRQLVECIIVVNYEDSIDSNLVQHVFSKISNNTG